jgi:hypothetical protein
MYAEKYSITLTTGTATATGYVPAATTTPAGNAITGKVHSIRYVKADSNSYSDGVDFTITSEATGATIWTEENVNASKTCYPRATAQTTAGVNSTLTEAPVILVNDRLVIAIAQGGNGTVGTFHVVIE